MPKYKLSPRAKRQLGDIWRGIAVHNETSADKLVHSLFDKFELAALHPEMGASRPDISRGARLIVEGRYVAIYEPAEYGVEIVVIVHGMRDPSKWLD